MVYLYVTTSMAKNVYYFSLGIRKVVCINFKLVLQLKLLVVKYRVGSIYK